jgi:hypothetical protein
MLWGGFSENFPKIESSRIHTHTSVKKAERAEAAQRNASILASVHARELHAQPLRLLCLFSDVCFMLIRIHL